MRVFCKAQQFAGVNIDENVVCESVSWLIQNQREDGALPEVHNVIHREMVVSNTSFNVSLDDKLKLATRDGKLIVGVSEDHPVRTA